MWHLLARATAALAGLAITSTLGPLLPLLARTSTVVRLPHRLATLSFRVLRTMALLALRTALRGKFSQRFICFVDSSLAVLGTRVPPRPAPAGPMGPGHPQPAVLSTAARLLPRLGILSPPAPAIKVPRAQ
jgi:hypothetical protein